MIARLRPLQASLLVSSLIVALGACGPAPSSSATDQEVADPATTEQSAALAAPRYFRKVLFNGGSEGYHSYRIPSIVRTTEGTLIAFAEGRSLNANDYGNINLVAKRSTNNGATWSALKVIEGQGPGTWGNPTAVVDAQTKRVWLFVSWNSATKNQLGSDGLEKIDTWGDRRLRIITSDDDGLDWSSPLDFTESLVPKNYTWDAMGPGVGIQTQRGPLPGRLIIPALGRNIYSDDHGKTWRVQLLPGGTSEATIAELSDGSLLRNDRAVPDSWAIAARRWVSRGTLEEGFPPFKPDVELLDPRSEGSSMVYTQSEPHRLMFLNAASTKNRCRMQIRISYDDGASWPRGRAVYSDLAPTEACNDGKGGYSSLVKTADFQVGALVEVNEKSGGNGDHRSIDFVKFNLPWILDGANEP